MGQQQILLLILGIIITFVAIAVGIQAYQRTALNSHIDTIYYDIANISNFCYQFYLRSLNMMGGAGSYSNIRDTFNSYLETGFFEDHRGIQTENAVYFIREDREEHLQPQEITITAVSRRDSNIIFEGILDNRGDFVLKRVESL